MRTGHVPAWFSKVSKKQDEFGPHDHLHAPSPFPSVTRSASKLSTFSSIHLHLSRDPSRDPSSALSVHSVHSSRSAPQPPPSYVPHPFSPMVSAPLPVVSNRDSIDDEEECPVCLEPLSFSFRLPGEKPHIVPECGHALHEACFTAVYGPPPSQNRTQGVLRKSNLGVCGVCRRPMKVGDGDGGKSNKLAALTGMGDRGGPGHFPGRETPNSMRGSTPNGRSPAPPVRPYDPNEDDPIEHAHSVKSAGANSDHTPYVVAPSIQVRPEFSSLTRNSEATQALTCIVVVELPGKRSSSHVPGPIMMAPYDHRNGNGHAADTSSFRQNHYGRQADVSDATVRRQVGSPGASFQSPSVHSPSLHAPSVHSTDQYARSTSEGHYNPPAATSPDSPGEDSPFVAITEDLRNRIIDWKGHPLSGLGPLRMFDLLSVRRDSLVREFYVYLFKEAIICVAEEKKRTLGRFLSTASGAVAEGSAGPSGQHKGVLRLKGRIYIRHIRQVTDTSVQGELSLTIDMEDERLDSFILIFKDRPSLETWKTSISSLVTYVPRSAQSGQLEQPPLDMEEFGGNSKAARMLSGSTGTTASTTDRDSLLHSSNRSTQSSYSSHHGSLATRPSMQTKLAPLEEDESLSPYTTPHSAPPLYAPHMSSGPSNSLTPLPHPPLDLLLIFSLPAPTTLPSTAALKIRVIKASLDFLIASLSPRDRLSIVTFEVGMGGAVRKTPFLSQGRTQSRARLAKFVDETGYRPEEGSVYEDEFMVRGSKDEKTDVVTAVNHALDVVLQRKSRNSVTGMILVSDAADSTRRAQMDLVLARAEAANVPIHSFGYGRSHDPASLWLMSNHTNGTYTFVKDWYDLRDCLAGCVGGMMSIGSMNMKLHMKIVDGNRFRIRKVSGGPSSIVASDGRNVDVDVGELRYGERKEMLVELELDNSDVHRSPAPRGHNRAMNATDRFNQSMGFDALAIEDMDLTDGMMDRMIDEVPVFEVDGSFFDPAAAKHVSRLAHPVLLTVTLLPTSATPQRQPTGASDPVIVRRRMELLASDMITRALVLISRKNFSQAQKIMSETKRILHTVLQSISQSLPPPGSNGNTTRNRKELLTLAAVRILQAIMQDMQILSDALEENVDLFAHDQRNFGAQQAMILRDQKSWTGRSATERVFWTVDNSIELVSRSTDWVARE